MGITFYERAQELKKPNKQYNKILDELIKIANSNDYTLPRTFRLTTGGVKSISEILDKLQYKVEKILAIEHSESSVREVEVKRK